ncbi:MAG: hypothetical protein ACMXYC_02545, partial [Candidatus Woesearchaeota archaeon]
MKTSVLPEDLDSRYKDILKTFKKKEEKLYMYPYGYLPDDMEYIKTIIYFLIDVIDYGIAHFDAIDIDEYQDFLSGFHLRFQYGCNPDSHNYLVIDECLDGEPLMEFCWVHNEDLSIALLEEMKQKHLALV